MEVHGNSVNMHHMCWQRCFLVEASVACTLIIQGEWKGHLGLPNFYLFKYRSKLIFFIQKIRRNSQNLTSYLNRFDVSTIFNRTHKQVGLFLFRYGDGCVAWQLLQSFLVIGDQS
jgi:hypothetical protein